MDHLQQHFGNPGAGTSGALDMGSVEELRKALEAGYGSDVANLTGGAALRIQSLESTMLATIQDNKHFRLMNALSKSNATATVDEWTEQNGVGGFLGGSTNSESGNIRDAQGLYKRRVGQVKYLMTRRQVTLVVSLQNSIVEAESAEYMSGAKQLMTDVEYLSFEGDEDVVPTEFDGIGAILKTNATPDHIIDMAGAPLNSIHKIDQASALISGYGNFGQPTDMFLSQNTQSDMNTNLDPAFRVSLNNVPGGGISLGSPVVGVRTSWGNIANQPDVFIRDEKQKMPFEVVNNGEHSGIATANAYAPAGVAVAKAVNAASKFAAMHGGNYYYAVAGVTANGQSVVFKSAQIAVASGESVTITITPSVANTETGYVIYRSRKDGTNGTADFREMLRVPKGDPTTVYIDHNTEIPGSTKAYILNLNPADKAITWRQFLPMMKFPLYPVAQAVIPWAQLLFGYLRLGKAKHHVMIKNIVPDCQVWRPFG